MEFGPVPSSAYNLIKRDDRAAAEDQETGIEALDFVLKPYGCLTPAQLSKISHNEPAGAITTTSLPPMGTDGLPRSLDAVARSRDTGPELKYHNPSWPKSIGLRNLM
jgi:hypothetical protein